MPKRRAHGEGTLYKRADGRWCAQITLPDGRRRTKYGKTKQTVVDWMTAQRAAIRSQTWVADQRITLGEFMAAYLKDVAEPSVRPRTLQSYHWLINKHITPALGHVRL